MSNDEPTIEEAFERLRESVKANTPPLDETHLDPPRWENGPPICKTENLPACGTEAALLSYYEYLSSRIAQKWECPHCHGWHARTLSPRHATLKIPPEVQAHNAILSRTPYVAPCHP